MTQIPGWKDKVLFTPGPLTTSQTIKHAMLRDLGSRDTTFIEVVADIRRRLVALTGAGDGVYEAIPMQGSGTFSVEAVLSSTVPRDGTVLVIVNGAYGERIARICEMLRISTLIARFQENEIPDIGVVKTLIDQHDESIRQVAIVHCETTTGIINPIAKFGALAKSIGATYFVDAMSSFGAVPINFRAANIDYLVSSANKCIEGVPGFGFAIARRDALLATEGYARSVSLDLLAQLKGLETNGQFRFTPPTHALLAFHRALFELEIEGGVDGRAKRYYTNYDLLVEGMRALGFKEYLDPSLQGYIITSFHYPEHPNWSFEAFYDKLSARDCLIYPGKVSNADCFRIGNIGRVFPADIHALLAAIRDVLDEMDVSL